VVLPEKYCPIPRNMTDSVSKRGGQRGSTTLGRKSRTETNMKGERRKKFRFGAQVGIEQLWSTGLSSFVQA
jgi:hypothetical protein